jgi:hypothetical protein
MENKEVLCNKFKEQVDGTRRKYQFELFRIEEAQKTEV